ncbi:MAG: AzlC family ABC transporter permease [Actinomycetota bacterium]
MPVADRSSIRRDALGIGAYAGAFGASFGAVSIAAGLTLPQTALLSLVMFTGASQFALVGVIDGGGALVAAIAAALLLGVRNAFYGVSMSQILGVRGRRGAVAAHFVIDETTAMAIARDDRAAQRYAFWATGVALYVCWNAGTLLGALGGSAVGDPESLGLDAAIPAAFLALLWPRLRDRTGRTVALGGALVATVLIPLAPAGVPVLAAAAVAVAAGLRPHSREEAS